MRSTETPAASEANPTVVELPIRSDRDTAATTAAAASTDESEVVPVSPPNVRTVFQGGIFVLALLAACYAAAEIILPIVLAFVLMLVLQPAMRLSQRLRVPRGLAAFVVIVMLFGTLMGLATVLSGPAASWIEKVPAGMPKLQERLSFISRPIAALHKFVARAENLAP